jgi:hypothetical protein
MRAKINGIDVEGTAAELEDFAHKMQKQSIDAKEVNAAAYHLTTATIRHITARSVQEIAS